jgi:hypothetical protein
MSNDIKSDIRSFEMEAQKSFVRAMNLMLMLFNNNIMMLLLNWYKYICNTSLYFEYLL